MVRSKQNRRPCRSATAGHLQRLPQASCSSDQLLFYMQRGCAVRCKVNWDAGVARWRTRTVAPMCMCECISIFVIATRQHESSQSERRISSCVIHHTASSPLHYCLVVGDSNGTRHRANTHSFLHDTHNYAKIREHISSFAS